MRMLCVNKLLSIVLILSLCACIAVKTVPGKGNAYTNGLWFNGKAFEAKTLYEIDGVFSNVAPEIIEEVIDLKGGFVIPPFGAGHNHNLDRKWQAAFLANAYLKEGTFYSQNLTSKSKGANELRPSFASASTLDVVYSQQGITSTLGHPFMAYEPAAMRLPWDDKVWNQNMGKILVSRIDENNSYIFIDSIDQVDEKLKALFDAKPDVAKIYLLDVENYEKRHASGVAGKHGLSEEVAREVVTKLKKAGLTVYAHIETASDFAIASQIGVDCVAHMPGYAYNGEENQTSKYYVSDDIIKQAVSNNLKVIPTVQAGLNRTDITDIQRKTEFVKDFLLRFKKAGGTIVLGADMFNNTLTPEIDAYTGLGVFSNQDILKTLTYDTPKAIYPNRKIGKLEHGYEASFLVLKSNPLDNIQSIKEIDLRVKQGNKLLPVKQEKK